MNGRKLRSLRKHVPAMAGLAVLAAFVALSLIVPLASPHDPYRRDENAVYQPPSLKHWFGTDDRGQDIFTRVWLAGRLSLLIGVLAVGVSVAVGVPIGAISGYLGGAVDWLLSRVVEVLLSFPSILLAITIAAAMGKGMPTIVIAVGIVGIPQFARQVRASVLVIREQEYVTASRALGAGAWRILWRQILPNAAGPIIVLATMGLASAILNAAALSFLGLGVETGTAEWGAMLHDGRNTFRNSPWLSIFSGAAITLTVLAVNLLGDGLRDALDPRSR